MRLPMRREYIIPNSVIERLFGSAGLMALLNGTLPGFVDDSATE